MKKLFISLSIVSLMACNQKTPTNQLVESINKDYKIFMTGKPNGDKSMFYTETLSQDKALLMEDGIKNTIDKELKSLPIKTEPMHMIDDKMTAYDIWETTTIKVEFSKIYNNDKTETFEMIVTEK